MWQFFHYLQDHLTLSIISAISPFIAAYIVQYILQWREDSWLYSLNKYLKQGSDTKGAKYTSKPIITELFQLLMIVLFVAGILLFVFKLATAPWRIGNLLFLLISLFALFAMIWEHRPLKKDTKGLVGILSHKIKDVLPSSLNTKLDSVDGNSIDSIYFAEHRGQNDEDLSYEERLPILEENRIKEIRNKRIVPYYESLKERINELVEKKTVNKELFYIEECHICDYLLQKPYSLSSIMDHIIAVNQSMESDNSINFIGDKIGVSGYVLNKGVLSLKIYLTDHFTFKVFKDIFLDKKYKEEFQIIIRRLNYASEREKELLVETLKFLFSSIGIDIVIYGKKADGRKGVLLALRNGDIERCRESKIHVPVNESFSKTDQQEKSDKYDLRKCVSRGIEEELGISQDLVESKCSFVFQDFSVVCDEGEIGLACYVDFTACMPLEQARMYPGQDKYMEIKDLIVSEMPAFYADADKYCKWFFRITESDAFCTNWESFTPLLYQRFILRNRRLPGVVILAINYFVSVAVFLYLALVCKILPFAQPDFIVGGVFTLVLGLIISIVINAKNTQKNSIYRLFKPLVQQWGGDATVIQSTSTSIDKGLFDGMYFGCIQDSNDSNLIKSLNELELVNAPFCKTRREGAKNHTEEPISFYQMRVSDSSSLEKKLFFREIPVFYSSSEDKLSVYFSVIFTEKDKRYFFTKELVPPVLNFDSSFSEEKASSLSKYFSIPKSELMKYKIASLSSSFNIEERSAPSFRPLDLFYYQNNYHWIVRSGRFDVNNVNVVNIGRGTNIYTEFVARLNQNAEFLLTGQSTDVINALVKFITHRENRNKITSLDIYALQLALIREDNQDNSLLLVQKEPKLKLL